MCFSQNRLRMLGLYRPELKL
ncbi:hypothetical protein BRAS3809_570006 [Bradyrhizobium sp. STM 3809]|nr:hypothetical protein BRAS3809_570006 [Bradyrhizobium sp. STM 3809]